MATQRDKKVAFVPSPIDVTGMFSFFWVSITKGDCASRGELLYPGSLSWDNSDFAPYETPKEPTGEFEGSLRSGSGPWTTWAFSVTTARYPPLSIH